MRDRRWRWRRRRRRCRPQTASGRSRTCSSASQAHSRNRRCCGSVMLRFTRREAEERGVELIDIRRARLAALTYRGSCRRVSWTPAARSSSSVSARIDSMPLRTLLPERSRRQTRPGNRPAMPTIAIRRSSALPPARSHDGSALAPSAAQRRQRRNRRRLEQGGDRAGAGSGPPATGACIWTSSSECPPRSKKLSSRPICFEPEQFLPDLADRPLDLVDRRRVGGPEGGTRVTDAAPPALPSVRHRRPRRGAAQSAGRTDRPAAASTPATCGPMPEARMRAKASAPSTLEIAWASVASRRRAR